MSIEMDLDRFASFLALRLSVIVPREFNVAASDGMLIFGWDPQTATSPLRERADSASYIDNDILGTHDKKYTEDYIASMAVQTLDEVQDFICETSGLPWLGTVRQPTPHSRVADSILYLWFADGDNLVLAVEPIPLSDVGFAG